MLLEVEHILKLAELSRLEISAAEVADVSVKLTAIVDLVNQLSLVDTAGVTPMAHPLNQTQRLRPDLVTERDDRELYQRNAQAVERGLYLVPKVIE